MTILTLYMQQAHNPIKLTSQNNINKILHVQNT